MTQRRNLLWVPIVMLLCFIWGNSMLSGDISGAISGGLLGWLIKTFPFLNWLPEYLLRKIGHFSEFALLGFLLSWYYLLQGQRGFHRFTLPLLLSVLAANVDETIQTVIPDRGPSVIDCWIDTAGACTGIAVLFALYGVIRIIRKDKTNYEKTDKPDSAADFGTDPVCRL